MLSLSYYVLLIELRGLNKVAHVKILRMINKEHDLSAVIFEYFVYIFFQVETLFNLNFSRSPVYVVIKNSASLCDEEGRALFPGTSTSPRQLPRHLQGTSRTLQRTN